VSITILSSLSLPYNAINTSFNVFILFLYCVMNNQKILLFIWHKSICVWHEKFLRLTLIKRCRMRRNSSCWSETPWRICRRRNPSRFEMNTMRKTRRRSVSHCSLESAPRSGTIPLSSHALLLSRRYCWSRFRCDRSAREGNRRIYELRIAVFVVFLVLIQSHNGCYKRNDKIRKTLYKQYYEKVSHDEEKFLKANKKKKVLQRSWTLPN